MHHTFVSMDQFITGDPKNVALGLLGPIAARVLFFGKRLLRKVENPLCASRQVAVRGNSQHYCAWRHPEVVLGKTGNAYLRFLSISLFNV